MQFDFTDVINGVDGATGATGPQGPQGATGPAGLANLTVDAPLTGAGSSASHLSIPAATSGGAGHMTATQAGYLNQAVKTTSDVQFNSVRVGTTNWYLRKFATTGIEIANTSDAVLMQSYDNGTTYILSLGGDLNLNSYTNNIVLSANDGGGELTVNAANINAGSGLTLNRDNQTNKGLILNGTANATVGSRRGGFIKWMHGYSSGQQDTTYYTYVNTDGKLVFDNNAQASNTDTGLAWVSLSDGSALFTRLNLDDTNTYIDNTSGDIVATTAAGKTLVLATPVYRDINLPIVSSHLPAANTPTWGSYTTNLSSYSFAVDDYVDLPSVSLPNDYKEGTAIRFHVHLIGSADSGMNDKLAKYTIYYSWGNPNTMDAMSAEASVTAEKIFGWGNVRHYLLDFTDITGTGYKVNSLLKLRIKRVANSGGGEPSVDPFVESVGITYQVDTLGSRAVLTK